jgi:hypothetical protein
VAFRQLTVVEVREILRRWSRGSRLRTVAAATGTDRKTSRRYVEAAKRHGFTRGDDVDDALLALVVGDALPGAQPRVGAMRELCRANEALITDGVREGSKAPKVARRLHRRLHRRVRCFHHENVLDFNPFSLQNARTVNPVRWCASI